MILVAIAAAAVGDNCGEGFLIRGVLNGFDVTICCSKNTDYEQCNEFNAYAIKNAGENSPNELCRPATAETPCCWSVYDSKFGDSNTNGKSGLFGQVICTSSDFIDYVARLQQTDAQSDNLGLEKIYTDLKCDADVAYSVSKSDDAEVSELHVSSVNCFPADNNGSPPPSPPPSPGLSGAAIGGIVGGSIGGVLLIGGAVYLYTRKRGNAVNYIQVDEDS